MLRPTPGDQLRPLATKAIKEMTATGIACVSEPFFLIIMNFSLRSRNLEVNALGAFSKRETARYLRESPRAVEKIIKRN